MDKKQIGERIKQFLQKTLSDGKTDLTFSTNLFDELFLDSLATIEVVMFIEREFHVNILEVEISEESFQTIDSLAEFVAMTFGEGGTNVDRS